MIRRLALHRASHWDREYQAHTAAAHLLPGTDVGTHAEHFASRARQKATNWENLLVVLGPAS